MPRQQTKITVLGDPEGFCLEPIGSFFHTLMPLERGVLFFMPIFQKTLDIP